MELQNKEINVCDYTKRVNTDCIVEADIIVPDVKPDIYKILCVNAMCVPGEHYIRKEKMIISGDVKFNIMYISDTDKSRIYTIDYMTPFNHQCDISGVEDSAQCMCKCVVSSTDFKIKNSRKLSAGAKIAIEASAFSYGIVNAIESISGEDSVPYKVQKIFTNTMVCFKEIEFLLSESVNIPGAETVEYVNDIKACIGNVNIKTVNNKAIVKIALPIKVLYPISNEPCTYETELNFTEIVDLDMASSESMLSYFLDVADVSYECELGDGNNVLNLELKLKGYIKAYDDVEYSLVNNIYSPDYNYTVETKSKKIEKVSNLSESQITVKDNIDLNRDNGDLNKLFYMNIYPSYTDVYYDNSSVKVKGAVPCVIIYSNEADELCSAQKVLPFEVDIPAETNCSNAHFDISLFVVNYGYILDSSQSIQARIVLRVCADMICEESITVINSFSQDKSNPKDKSDQAGITICYPDSDMTLWDYAVKYNTTCEDIATANNIEVDSPLVKGKALLIPKRHV